jgi:hypothetical protein
LKISLRPVLIGLIALVGVFGLLRVVPETNVDTASSAGACDSSNPGVTLVVDFGAEANLPALIKCAEGFNLASNPVSNELNGWQVFKAAGVEVEGTDDFPVGFVCRIAGFPTVANQPCDNTPSYSSGHWAYFYAVADAGKSWQFSGTGSTNRKPTCGSVEGWLFVKGEASTGSGSSVVPSVAPKAFKCRQ